MRTSINSVCSDQRRIANCWVRLSTSLNLCWPCVRGEPPREPLHAIVNRGLAVWSYAQDLLCVYVRGQSPCPETEQAVQVWGELVSAGLASAHF